MKRLLLLTLLIPLSFSIGKSSSCNLQNYDDDIISCLNYEASYHQVDENIFFWQAVKELLKFLGKEIVRSGISYSVEKILDDFLYEKIKRHIVEIWDDAYAPSQCKLEHFNSCEICQNLEDIISKLEKADADVLEALAVTKKMTLTNQREIENILRIIKNANNVSNRRISKLESNFSELKKDYFETKRQVEANTGMIASNSGKIYEIENYMYSGGFSDLQLYDEYKNLIVTQENRVSWFVTPDKKIRIKFDVANCRPKNYFTFDFYFFESYSSSTIYPRDGYVMGNTGCFTCVEGREITWDVIGQRKNMLGGGNLYLNVYKKSKSECRPSNRMEKLKEQGIRLEKQGEYIKFKGKRTGWFHRWRTNRNKRKQEKNKRKWGNSQQP